MAFYQNSNATKQLDLSGVNMPDWQSELTGNMIGGGGGEGEQYVPEYGTVNKGGTGAPDGYDPIYGTTPGPGGGEGGDAQIEDRSNITGFISGRTAMENEYYSQDFYDKSGKYTQTGVGGGPEYSDLNLFTDFVKLSAVAYGGGALLTAGLGAAGAGAAGGAGGAGAAEAAAIAADTAGGLIPAYGTNAAYTAGLGMTEAGVASLASTVGEFGALTFAPETVAQSISSAVGNNFSKTIAEWVSGVTGGGTSGGGALSSIGGAVKSASAWLTSNPALANILGTGVAAFAKGKSDDKLVASRNAETEKAREDKREEDNRYRASVSGMRQPGGLIQQSALARTDGSQVFNGRGLINRG